MSDQLVAHRFATRAIPRRSPLGSVARCVPSCRSPKRPRVTRRHAPNGRAGSGGLDAQCRHAVGSQRYLPRMRALCALPARPERALDADGVNFSLH